MIILERPEARPRRFGPTSKFILSVDLGQTIDPTACALLEIRTRADVVRAFFDTPEELRGAIEPQLVPDPKWFPTVGEGGPHWPNRVVRIDVRHLERMALRTNYVDVVDHVRQLLRRPPLDARRVELVVDQTGVGRPVVDMFRRTGLRPIAVTITAGNGETKETETDWKVSKLLLVPGCRRYFTQENWRLQRI